MIKGTSFTEPCIAAQFEQNMVMVLNAPFSTKLSIVI